LLGGAAAGALLTSGQSLPTTTNLVALQNTFVSSFHAALLVCAAFAAIGIFTALARGNGEVTT
jgi:type II secretory pathway component PulF